MSRLLIVFFIYFYGLPNIVLLLLSLLLYLLMLQSIFREAINKGVSCVFLLF